MKKLACFLAISFITFGNLSANEWFSTGEFKRLNLEKVINLESYTTTRDGKYFIVMSKDSVDKEHKIYIKIHKYNMSDGSLFLERNFKFVDLQNTYIHFHSKKIYLSSDGITLVYPDSLKIHDPDFRCQIINIDSGKSVNTIRPELNDYSMKYKKFTYYNIDFISQNNNFISNYKSYAESLPSPTTKWYDDCNHLIISRDFNWSGQLYSSETFDYEKKTSSEGPNLYIHQFNLKENRYKYWGQIRLKNLGYNILNYHFAEDSIVYINAYAKTKYYMIKYNLKRKKIISTQYIYDQPSGYKYYIDKNKFMSTKDIYTLQYGYKQIFFSTKSRFPIYEYKYPDTLQYLYSCSLTLDDSCFIMLNKNLQLIKYRNPFMSDSLKSFFTVNEKYIFEKNSIQTYNYSTGSAEKYIWDFGDGEQSNEIEPKHEYKLPGKYTISLKVIKGEKENISYKEIEVAPAYNVSFEVSDSTKSLPIIYTFKNTSNGKIDSLKWDFGAGTKSTSTNEYVKHTYIKEGKYKIQLIGFNSFYKDTAELFIDVNKIRELKIDSLKYFEKVFANDPAQIWSKYFETSDGGAIVSGYTWRLPDLAILNNKYEIAKRLNKVDIINPLNYCFNENPLPMYYNDKIFILDKSQLVSITSSKTIGVYNNNLDLITTYDLKTPVYGICQSSVEEADFGVISTSGKFNFQYNTSTKSLKIIDSNDIKYAYLPTSELNYTNPVLKWFTLAYTHIGHNYKNNLYAYYEPRDPTLSRDWYNNSSTLKMKQNLIFRTFRNITQTDFVGLSDKSQVFKFNEAGDSLKIISFSGSLKNIAIIDTLYYVVGEINNSPICYIFDNELNIKDTIAVESRHGCFWDAVIDSKGDLVFCGEKYKFVSTDTTYQGGPYIFKIKNYRESDSVKLKQNRIIINNPVTENLYLQVANGTIGTYLIEVFDIQGNVLKSLEKFSNDGNLNCIININNFSTGIYFIKVNNGKEILTSKIVKV